MSQPVGKTELPLSTALKERRERIQETIRRDGSTPFDEGRVHELKHVEQILSETEQSKNDDDCQHMVPAHNRMLTTCGKHRDNVVHSSPAAVGYHDFVEPKRTVQAYCPDCAAVESGTCVNHK
jgi:hypothetical protein